MTWCSNPQCDGEIGLTAYFLEEENQMVPQPAYHAEFCALYIRRCNYINGSDKVEKRSMKMNGHDHHTIEGKAE